MKRVYNFNPGPAVIPGPVLERVRGELDDLGGSGLSILEHSHRGELYSSIHQGAIDRLRRLMNIPARYSILLMQGGASLQFALIPLNLLKEGRTGLYVVTGAWSQKALEEGGRIGAVRAVASSADRAHSVIPDLSSYEPDPESAYLHLTSNNTIYGTQWRHFPQPSSVPLIADMSSDILSREIDIESFALIYAGAQKNMGAAGLTVVLIRDDLLEACRRDLPRILSYRTFASSNSLYNTPPTFTIYLFDLMLEWIDSRGGLRTLEKESRSKAECLYSVIDGSDGFYSGLAEPQHRSRMNVTFRLPSADLERRFLEQAEKQGFIGLKGHRSIGGVRASLYNGLPLEAVEKLAVFMKVFRSGSVP